MAEEPRTFTVGPWGYRVLLPSILNIFLPPRSIVAGFDWAARLSLVAASGLLFVYLRILGGTRRAALLATAALMVTPSVGAVFANPFLVEPFGLLLLLIGLIAIEGDADEWSIALSLVALSLAKEIWVVLLPLVFIKALEDGPREAAVRTLRVAAPALWVSVLMRWMWAPQAASGRPDASYGEALITIASHVTDFAPHYLLGGLSLAALVALHKENAREYLIRNALTLFPLLALPLVAAAYTGEGAATSFFMDDVRRLLIYTIPFAAGLAVHLDPAQGPTRVLDSSPRLPWAARAVVIVLLIAPLTLDRYSRADLSTSRDGPYVLGFARETLRTARKLDRGEVVVFDPAERKFAWGVSPPRDLQKLRFFLRGGFGPLAHYGIHDIKMRETAATMILPVLEPRRVLMRLTMDARESAWVTFSSGGRKVGEALIGPQPVKVTLDIAGDRLFRGDNPLELHCDKGFTAMPRLLRIEIEQEAARP